jgi:hypothetical protein
MREGLALIQTCKQIHVEASKVFYSKNEFFWLCSSGLDKNASTQYSTWLEPRHLLNIQQVVVAFSTEIPVINPHAEEELTYTFNHVAEVVGKFRRSGVKLKTLSIYHRSEFDGMLDQMYRDPSAAFQCSAEPVQRIVQDVHGNMSSIEKREDGELHIAYDPFDPYKPLQWARILDPLLALSGRVEYFKARCDLPQHYIQEIHTKILNGVQILAPIKKRMKLEAKLAKEGHMKRKKGGCSLETFVAMSMRQGKASMPSHDCCGRQALHEESNGNSPMLDAQQAVPAAQPSGSGPRATSTIPEPLDYQVLGMETVTLPPGLVPPDALYPPGIFPANPLSTRLHDPNSHIGVRQDANKCTCGRADDADEMAINESLATMYEDYQCNID